MAPGHPLPSIVFCESTIGIPAMAALVRTVPE